VYPPGLQYLRGVLHVPVEALPAVRGAQCKSQDRCQHVHDVGDVDGHGTDGRAGVAPHAPPVGVGGEYLVTKSQDHPSKAPVGTVVHVVVKRAPPEQQRQKRHRRNRARLLASTSEVKDSSMTLSSPRINSLEAGVKGSEALDILEGEAGTSLQQVIETHSDVQVIRERFYPIPESQPGRWIGRQSFVHIPDTALFCVVLASVFHIGAHTHLGCGTFIVD